MVDAGEKVVAQAADAGADLAKDLTHSIMTDLTLANIVGTVAAGAMVIGGIFPFIPQYRDIYRSQNAEGFSLFVCLTLLIANILRILFCAVTHSIMKDLTLANIVGTVAAGAMVIGGIFPFIPQYRDIYRSQNAEGFSLFVCLTLLIANILRILFWFGKHYELPLLAQSIIMTFTMLALVELCVRVKSKSEIIKGKQTHFTDTGSIVKARTFLDFDWDYFWKWTDFSSYLQFTAVFSIFMLLVTYTFLDSWLYVETLGFMAVFAEAMLGAPQFYRNFQNKSTQGMSKKMVAMWTCGDIYKTCYFILRAAPAQFWICGMMQIGIDIAIFIQVFVYRNLIPKTAIK